MFWFLLITMVVVVAAVTLAVVGGGDSEVLPEVAPEQLVDPLPVTRPVDRADVEALRLPVAARGYRMADVDDVLVRLGAELAERDARIAELEEALAGPGGGSGFGHGGSGFGTGGGSDFGTGSGSGSGGAEGERP
ncbi:MULTISPECIES: hypothetical protein [unclassified Streptomyces]|uniref:hypothetical protein n=1 Tax=unclassified Streptomyces TaxID=2593676 RepID=UPI0035D9B67F